MDKNLQDLTWSVLPKEYRKEVKKEYRKCLNGSWYTNSYIRGQLRILCELFGIYNIISDADEKEVDIPKLDKMLNEALEKETADSLNEWADNKEEPKSDTPKLSMKPIESKVGVYLATAEEDEEFRRLLHKNGFKWNSNRSLIELSYWSSYMEDSLTHYVYPDKTVTYCRARTPALTFSEFKKEYFGENVNHRQNIVNCDKYPDNHLIDNVNNSKNHIVDNNEMVDRILKDSFRNERRLNIATQIMSSILSNQMMLNNLAHGETTAEDVVKCVVNATMMYTDALLAECEEGGKS